MHEACVTLDALWIAACPDEARWFFDWMAGAVEAQFGAGAEADLQIMFDVGGEQDLPERTLPRLSGWRGSQSVRVGNGAWEQRQLDVYGELLSAARRLRHQIGPLDEVTRAFLVAVADAAAIRWKQQNQGIREVRGTPRASLYSKLMCWVALDSAIALADLLSADGSSMHGDSSIVIAATMAWRARKGHSPRAPSGWPYALALAGEVGRAQATFEHAVAHVNDVGLLANEVSPVTGQLLGDFPQAFSHSGLVNAARAIDVAT